MSKNVHPTALPYLPQKRELSSLKQAATGCHGCDLFRNATQTVFGEGRPNAEMIFVGEQPGNQEDKAGLPFVGPAGKLFEACLKEAGIYRDLAYVTNAVKHFKWVPRGKRRLHERPNLEEVRACRPWLDAEVEAIQPRLIVCLGATAAQSLLGPQFRVTQSRGLVQTVEGYPPILATVHPSSILRARTDDERELQRRSFVEDLIIARKALAKRKTADFTGVVPKTLDHEFQPPEDHSGCLGTPDF